MTSPLNPNQQSGGGGFDMSKFLKPSSPNPPNTSNLISSPSFPNPGSSSPSPSPIPTPSSSYPPPSSLYTFHHQNYLPYPPPPPQQHHHLANMHQPQMQIAYPSPASPNPNSGGARLMALLSTQNAEFASSPVIPRSPSAKMSGGGGRRLIGERVVYDVDVRLQGEVQPQQLTVTPITKYISDPGLLLGRQIAVNRNYICYGLKMGNIRVLDINTALRALLRGHNQRVTDMAFFAEDVHLLASASADGRVFIWKISEGPDEEDKTQITGKIFMALQIVGEGKSVHPRVCWHPHKQENLMVAIGNRILKIDTTKVGKGKVFSAEEPLQCPIGKPIEGVHFVGEHDAEVTELSMCQWMTSRLASASVDGSVKIWADRKTQPLAVLRPHNGDPVNSVTFLTAPHRPDHIVLITGGPLNREVKIWASAIEEGWLLPSDTEFWQCTQALDLRSSAEQRVEDAFFNQAVALSRTGLLLLANAKKNALYAVHIDYGLNPSATRMDYIAEFTVAMPILSLTGTSDSLPDGEHIVQVYCVQTQAIQQYALGLSQCLPPPMENMELEKTDSNVSRAFDAASSDSFVSFESSHGSKPTEVPVGSATPVLPILASSSESALLASCPVNLASSDVSSLPETSTSGMEGKTISFSSPNNNVENIHTALPPLPLSPRLSRNLSGFRNPSNSFEPSTPVSDHGSDQLVLDYSVDQRIDTVKENVVDVPPSGDNLRKGDKNVAQNDISIGPNLPRMFKHPTHLVTPSEILSTAASSENSQISQGMIMGESKVQDVVINNDSESTDVEVKVVSKEFDYQRESHVTIAEKKEKAFYSQASDLGLQMVRDCSVETYSVEGIRQVNGVSVSGTSDQPPYTVEEVVQDMTKNVTAKVGDSETPMTVPPSLTPATKGKRQKGKISQVSGPSSPSPSPFNSTDSSNEAGSSSGTPSTGVVLSQLSSMQEMLDQLMGMQKEMQKQMNVMVSAPVTKEGKRLEGSLGRSVEKVVKANADALWARFEEENAKHEKLERDHTQQITNSLANCVSKDLPALLEKTLKKETASVGPAVVRAITPTLEKTISSAIAESFQKGVGEKAVIQLEKSVGSKLEATVARQIQGQFQTSGKQALQDALRSSLEASIIPAFEGSCKAIFEQVDSTLQKGLIKHTTAAQQQFESTHSPLAIALRDAINSASSITRTLSGDMADAQRKLLAIAAAGANSQVPLVTQLSNGPLAGLHEMAEAPLDPTKELSRLINEHKFEEAFAGALHRSDVSIVSWLCSQVDLHGILSLVPIPLSQGVLLALLQQLACDINNETPRKLAWMRDVAIGINPADPMIAMHVRPIFEQVYQILGHHRNVLTTSASEVASIRILMHVINSVLMSCK